MDSCVQELCLPVSKVLPRSRCQRISSHRFALESLWPTQTKLEFGDCAL